MSNVKSIMIVGVGGQGTLLASRILGELLLSQGFDVKVSEVHGMSQRGGSVVTYVRYGDSVASPTIEEGGADYLLSFELCEAARWCRYLKPDGILLTSSQKILPMPVITGAAKYPEAIEEKLLSLFKSAIIADALPCAQAAGSSKAVNVVLMGMLSMAMGIDEAAWKAAIEKTVRPQFVSLNLKAFESGRELYKQAKGEASK